MYMYFYFIEYSTNICIHVYIRTMTCPSLARYIHPYTLTYVGVGILAPLEGNPPQIPVTSASSAGHVTWSPERFKEK